MTAAGAPRYALYFAPEPSDPWWGFGTRWLGADPATGAALPRLPVPGVDEALWRQVTGAPRFYGFHATLKPPFTLRSDATEQDLLDTARHFARDWQPFALPGLMVASLGDFVALRLPSPCPALHHLADACVRGFEPLRGPLPDAEVQQRMKPSLSPREREHLLQWGYPYVLDTFRFHMSLTGPVAPTLRARIADGLGAACAPWSADPVPVTGVCIFRQPDRVTPFRLQWRAHWGGTLEDVGTPAP